MTTPSRQFPPDVLYLHNPWDVLTDVVRGYSVSTGQEVLLTGQAATAWIHTTAHGSFATALLSMTLTEVGVSAVYGGTSSRAAVDAALAARSGQSLYRMIRVGDYEWCDQIVIQEPRPSA